MSYPAELIINIVTRINAAGLGLANFGQMILFAEGDESTDVTFLQDTYRDYASPAAIAEDFALTSEVYIAGERIFAAIPRPVQLRIYLRKTVVTSPAVADTPMQSVTKAIQAGVWFYWTFFTKEVYAVDATVLALASLCDANEKFFVNMQSATDIIDPALNTDIGSLLTAQGTRRAFTLRHSAPVNFESSIYAGAELAAIFSRVNFSAADSTITGEFKKLPGVQAEDLSLTAYNAMIAKKVVFYTQVETGGQVDQGRVINSITHSTYGEFIDDVFNLDAFVNALKVGLYNELTKQGGKVPQTPGGQLMMINAAAQVGEQYINNGYLGERLYDDPDTGIEKLSFGYQIWTKPEDILTISDADRAARKCAPIRMTIFRAGAIHSVDVTVDVL